MLFSYRVRAVLMRLEDIDTNKLFHLLPQQHRDAFLAAIRDPDSEAGRELLATMNDHPVDGTVEDDITSMDLPWWERPELPEDPEDDGDEELSYANEPEPIAPEVLAGVIPPLGVGNKLVYNALAIW